MFGEKKQFADEIYEAGVSERSSTVSDFFT